MTPAVPPGTSEAAAALRPLGDARASVALDVWGTVQGVGFRPHVHRLASSLGLRGFVRNRGAYVEIAAEGAAPALATFIGRLAAEAPPAARVEGLACRVGPPAGLGAFAIAASDADTDRPAMAIPPDLGLCADCRRDMAEPGGRYEGYPFTSCTQCGPRYTIARRLPFDRATTAMDAFPMCPDCRAEYDAPASRRFHAQATACARCGPRLLWLAPDGRPGPEGEEALARAHAALRAGAIVAVMGVGGVHLAVNALDDEAVRRLRERKRRPARPLAVLMDEGEVEHRCVLAEEEWALLRSSARPIVLLRRRPGSPLAPSVAPGMARLGVMLPYTGVHVRLLAEPTLRALVMTSGNMSGDPLAYTREGALSDLGPLVDGLLVHDREILRPTDDSVVRLDDRRPVVLRRARGYVPEPIPLTGADPGLTALAVGGDLKNAFALLRDARIWLAPHVGDLENARTLDLFERQVAWQSDLLGVRPDVVVHDMHPGYASVAYALRRPEPHLAVQHHHAHMAACLLEHGVERPALGVILDGTGFGEDGTIWGGEFLLGDRAQVRRVGHLRTLRLVGGDEATREPWRLALGYLWEAGLWARAGEWARARLDVAPARADMLRRVLESRFPGHRSTSAGRLFDAAGALVTGQATATFEAELPMRLEALVEPAIEGAYPLSLAQGMDGLSVDFAPALEALVRDLRAGEAQAATATRFHRGFARAMAAAAIALTRRFGVTDVALGGGVWQNEWLLRWFLAETAEAPFAVHVPRRLPPGDGGLAVGQLAVLAARAAAGAQSSAATASAYASSLAASAGESVSR